MPNKLQKQPRSNLVWQHVPQFVKIEGFLIVFALQYLIVD
jgi:hypothetical protein